MNNQLLEKGTDRMNQSQQSLHTLAHNDRAKQSCFKAVPGANTKAVTEKKRKTQHIVSECVEQSSVREEEKHTYTIQQ